MPGEEIAFECRRCGACCVGLLVEDMGVLKGLTLLPGEEKAFPDDIVEPAVGLGRSPQGQGFKVIAYQMIEETCPHLGEGECWIYDERPASCRQFPFSLREMPDGRRQMGFDLSCPALRDAFKEQERPRFRFDAKEHAERLLKAELEASADPRRAWFFDMEERSWKRYAELGVSER